MKLIFLGIWLSVLGCIDLKYKEIPLSLTLLGGGVGILLCIVEGRLWTDILLSCVPGAIALIFSRLTQEVLGYGDGMVFLVMGLYMTLSKLLSLGMMAFGLAGLVSLVLLVVFRRRGSERIPFIPFLVLAFGLESIIK